MITLPARLMTQITKAAEQAYPNECCGLLAGFGDLDGDLTITRVEASDNVYEGDQRHRFEVDPVVRLNLMRQLGDGPERIIGHYHSHPGHPPQPSQHDLKMAYEPDLLWLIVALADGGVTDSAAHRVNAAATAFEELPLSVI